MYEKVLFDKDVPLECKRDYLKEDWYNVCELIDYYNQIWRNKKNGKKD